MTHLMRIAALLSLAPFLGACVINAPPEAAEPISLEAAQPVADEPPPAAAPEPTPAAEPGSATAPAPTPAPAAFGGVWAGFALGGVPLGPTDAAWDSLAAAEIGLMQQMIEPPVGGGSVASVRVRAMHDGEWLAVLLEWDDPTVDDAVGVDTFRDAAAVGFPLGDGLQTSPFMGDATHPVAIWQWTANGDADARGEGRFDENYPETEGVWYMPQDAVVREGNKSWRGLLPMDSFVARGFGSLERAPSDSLSGAGVHRDGVWRVVMRRRLAAEEPGFAPGEETHVIIALWEGAQREVNGRKSVTMMWTPFVLAPAP